MIEDPIDTYIRRVKEIASIIALTLMDERLIISVGMRHPNTIVTIPLYFERLDSETAIRRGVAQYQRSLQLGREMTALYLLSLTKGLERAIRSASKR